MTKRPEDDEEERVAPDSETPPEGGTVRRRGVSSRGEHDEIAFAERRQFLAGPAFWGFERGDVSNGTSDRRPNPNFQPLRRCFSPHG